MPPGFNSMILRATVICILLALTACTRAVRICPFLRVHDVSRHRYSTDWPTVRSFRKARQSGYRQPFRIRSYKSLIRRKRTSFWPEKFVVYLPQISSWSSVAGPYTAFKLTCNADFANFCQSGQSPFGNSEFRERHCCSDFDDTFRYRTGGGLHSQGLCTEKVQAAPFGSRLFSSTLKTDCGFSSQQRMGTAGRCHSPRNYL